MFKHLLDIKFAGFSLPRITMWGGGSWVKAFKLLP